MLARAAVLVLAAVPIFAQTPCEGTPAYSPCELVYELSAADLAKRFRLPPQTEYEQRMAAAPQNKSTHFRGAILGAAADRSRVYLPADKPNPPYLYELDRRILAIHKRGLTSDLILGSNPDYM